MYGFYKDRFEDVQIHFRSSANFAKTEETIVSGVRTRPSADSIFGSLSLVWEPSLHIVGLQSNIRKRGYLLQLHADIQGRIRRQEAGSREAYGDARIFQKCEEIRP